ncbi:MAG: glycosyltransferase family 9 protein [Planctomycetota bacterium]
MTSTAVTGSGDTNRPRSVLCVRLGAIGDVANALTVASAIKAADPDVRVGWATHPLSAPLVCGHPAVDRVHLVPRTRSPRALAGVVRELRSGDYDAALDLQRLQKSALLARLSGARRVVGFDRPRTKEVSWIWTNERIATGPREEHMLLQYMRFPRLLGFADESTPPPRELPSDPEAVAFAEALVDELRSPVLLNLGASKPAKLWPAGSFRALCQELLAAGVGPLVLLGGPGDKELGAEVAAGLDVRDLSGATTLPMVWEIARRARVMVTGDTGAMHLAAAVGAPVVAVFGPGDAGRTGPYGPGHVLLRGGVRVPSLDGLAPGRGSAVSRMDETPVGPVREAVLEIVKTAESRVR